MSGNSFTDEDVKNMQKFLEFIADKAQFNLSWAESVQLAQYRTFMHQMVRKAHDHVMELKNVVQAEPETESKQSKGKQKKASK